MEFYTELTLYEKEDKSIHEKKPLEEIYSNLNGFTILRKHGWKFLGGMEGEVSQLGHCNISAGWRIAARVSNILLDTEE